MRSPYYAGLFAIASLLAPRPSAGQVTYFFSTGAPDGKIGTTSRPGSATSIETESADDFLTTSTKTLINHATFTGLITGGSSATVGNVVVEIYRVFPLDSTFPPSGNVPTRNNSPSDVAFDSKDAAGGGLSFTSTTLASGFTAGNSVLNGINKVPNQTTGGEGQITGSEVQFDIKFATPFDLPADHYFFVPQVEVTNGSFFWLSAPKPIVAPGTPFTPDLQSWIRNANLDPDWLRVGTDVVGAGTFNASFSLNGTSVPEPGISTLACIAGTMVAVFASKKRSVWRR